MLSQLSAQPVDLALAAFKEDVVKLTIDNLDGNGVMDYSEALAASRPLLIQRKLNAPSICSFGLVLTGVDPEMPARNGRVIVTDDNGVILFTGYVAIEPTRQFAGAATAGAIYQLFLSAVSDEILLDRQSVPQTRATAGQTVGELFSTLTSRVDPTRFSVSETSTTPILGYFQPKPGDTWSQNTAAMASQARFAYSSLLGQLNLSPIGNVTHVLSETAGTLQVKALQASMVKPLANDVTLCGGEEPGAYVTEVFQGDGITVLFNLTRLPYFPSASHSKPLVDLFQGPTLDPILWRSSDPGSHLSLTSAGLSFNGGTGTDGQTVVTAIDSLEVGGTLVVEAGGVQFGVQSAGILCGLYAGNVIQANCLAGFLVEQVAGVTTLTPVIEGITAGVAFVPSAGHSYTLRIRMYGKEVQRILATYYAVGDAGEISFGGSAIGSSSAVVMEIQDITSGATEVSTTVYDGLVANAPALVNFAPVNSTNLAGSIARVTVTEEECVWVTSQDPGGSVFTRKLGLATQGADARIERTGKLRFYSYAIPAVTETITVTYRTSHRSVARMASAPSIAAEAHGSIPGVAKWVGSVDSPVTRSSADCENAALAFLTGATSRAAAWAGTYTSFNVQSSQDIWPGNVLAVNAASGGLNANLVVRAVTIEVGSSSPDLTKYTIAFANDWAEAISLKLSPSVPRDAWLPQTAQTAVMVLASLSGLTISSVTGLAIGIAAGVSAAPGGGFEVRRSDWRFAPGNDSELVLRSPVSNFIIPREAAIEQYYIREYDGSTPPNYSRFSSAVFLNLPL
jgi:hypothetical protein